MDNETKKLVKVTTKTPYLQNIIQGHGEWKTDYISCKINQNIKCKRKTEPLYLKIHEDIFYKVKTDYLNCRYTKSMDKRNRRKNHLTNNYREQVSSYVSI